MFKRSYVDQGRDPEFMNNPVLSIIVSEKDIKTGVSFLIGQCPYMEKVYQKTGMPPLRLRASGFEGLARIIVGQQVSVASANAIWAKFSGFLGEVTVENCQSKTEEALRGCGVSRPKVRTLLAVCDAATSGELNFDRFSDLSYEGVHDILTRVKGIGPWTSDVYAMFCLGHSDAWAPGDLALQYAVQEVLSLDEKPDGKAMTEHAERWRPWRGVAARMLWAYYSDMKANKSGVPV
ncbi:MAG: DNA-3-methyladenine glycosylase family protein [Methyloligellaceae bacterium]